MASVTVSSRSDLLSAVANASAGDTILLEAGNYGSVDLNNANFSDYVTIRSLDADNPARFTDFGIYNSSHVRVDGVHVSAPNNGAPAVKIVDIDNGSHHIEFLNSEVNGLVDGDYSGFYGIHTGSSTHHVKIHGNNVHDVKVAIVVNGTTDFVVTENFTDMIGEDDMKFISVHRGLIEDNIGGGRHFQQPGGHMDYIQILGGVSSDLVFRGNVYLAPNLRRRAGHLRRTRSDPEQRADRAECHPHRHGPRHQDPPGLGQCGARQHRSECAGTGPEGHHHQRRGPLTSTTTSSSTGRTPTATTWSTTGVSIPRCSRVWAMAAWA